MPQKRQRSSRAKLGEMLTQLEMQKLLAATGKHGKPRFFSKDDARELYEHHRVELHQRMEIAALPASIPADAPAELMATGPFSNGPAQVVAAYDLDVDVVARAEALVAAAFDNRRIMAERHEARVRSRIDDFARRYRKGDA